MFQGEAVQKLHGDETFAFMLADFVDGADIGMVQSGSGASFAAKSFESLRILRDVFGKKFEGDEAAKGSVFGLVDHTHAAATESFYDAVVGNGLANHMSLLVANVTWAAMGKSMNGRGAALGCHTLAAVVLRK